MSPSFLVKILCYTWRPFTITLTSSAIMCSLSDPDDASMCNLELYSHSVPRWGISNLLNSRATSAAS